MPGTKMISLRIDLALFKQVIDYSAENNVTQSEALHLLIHQGLENCNQPSKLAKSIDEAVKSERKNIFRFLHESEKWSITRLNKSITKFLSWREKTLTNDK